MKIEIPKNVLKILKVLHDNAHDAYIVGGCVRDAILGRIPNDWDITTDAKPHEVKALFHRTIDTGIQHGTVTVRMGGESYEVTTYRIDGTYSDNRHPDAVTFTDDLREDLRRRDFTINAMAYSPRTGVVDAFGGISDLEAGIIRAVGDPDERFSEDALRILRAVRFAGQLNYEIEEETFRAITKHGPDLINVSEERIFTEINNLLLSDHPEKLALVFDARFESHICDSFPTITRDRAAALDAALPAKKHLRWADLCRDSEEWEARDILLELKADNDTIKKTVTLVEEMKREMPSTETEIRRLLHDIGPELFDDLAALQKAPAEILATKEKILERGDAYTLRMLAITGGDLMQMGYRQGPAIGETLEKLLDLVIEHPEMNTFETLKRSLCE